MMVDESLTTRLDPCCQNRIASAITKRRPDAAPLGGDDLVVIDSAQERQNRRRYPGQRFFKFHKGGSVEHTGEVLA
jgi:hypothetical protein